MAEIDSYRNKKFIGRDLRLFVEWESIDKIYGRPGNISYIVKKRNEAGLPTAYQVVYRIHSFCGVSEPDSNGLCKPLFADQFVMRINIPNNYPSMDAKLEFRFVVENAAGMEIPHPWHPNIRYYGDFAGRVCLNAEAFGSFTDLSWYIDRVARYLTFETYHAKIGVPPFPEDDTVAEWVIKQAEPQGWIEELKKYHNVRH